jgi:peptidoglycan/LPS O-acetylase OafA/YrhL
MEFKEIENIAFVRFLAILLITNSHLDNMYPIHHLGTGGAIGNSLFFMLSGYGLALSYKNKERPFLQWYWRRITRIYPSLIVVVTIFIVWLEGTWRYWTWRDYIAGFVWPTHAWFIAAIMIFYMIFFIIMKLKRPLAFTIGIFILFIPYFHYYFRYVDFSTYTIEGPGYFKWIFYLQIMLFGGYLAYQNISHQSKGYVYMISLIIALTAYYTSGILITLGYFGRYQFIVHILTFPIVFFITKLSYSHFVNQKILKSRTLNFVICLMAGTTLEIYLLHGFVYSSKMVNSLIFPVNIFVFWLIVLLFAKTLETVSGYLRNVLRRYTC